jgi:hypothetical protein
MTERQKIIEALKIAEDVNPGGGVDFSDDGFWLGVPDRLLTEDQRSRLRDLDCCCVSFCDSWYYVPCS